MLYPGDSEWAIGLIQRVADELWMNNILGDNMGIVNDNLAISGGFGP